MRSALLAAFVLASGCGPEVPGAPPGASSTVVAEGEASARRIARRPDGTLVVVAWLGEGWTRPGDGVAMPEGMFAFFLSTTGEVEGATRLVGPGAGGVVPLADGFALFAEEGAVVDPDGEGLVFDAEPGERLLLVRLTDDGRPRWSTVLEGVTSYLPFGSDDGVVAFAEGDGAAWAAAMALGEVRVDGQVVGQTDGEDPQALVLRLDAATGGVQGALVADGQVGSGVHTLLPDGGGVVACGMLAGYGHGSEVTFGEGPDAVTLPFSSDDDPASTPFLLGLGGDLGVRYGLAVEALGPTGLCAASPGGVDLLVSPPYYGTIGLGDARLDEPVGLAARLDDGGNVLATAVVTGAEATYRARPVAVGPRGAGGARALVGVVGGGPECGDGGLVAPGTSHAWAAPDDPGGFPCEAHLVTVDLDAAGAIVDARPRFVVPDGDLWGLRGVVTPGGICVAVGTGASLGAPGAARLSDPSPGLRVACDAGGP